MPKQHVQSGPETPHLGTLAFPTRRRRRKDDLAEQVYLRIRDRILHGRLALGVELPRRKLAAEYGVSFIPITEALQRLETEGLVESRPRVGTRVRVPTLADVHGQHVLREALLCQASRRFAEQADAQARSELVALATELDQWNTCDARHRAGNPIAVSTHRRQRRMQWDQHIGLHANCPALAKAIAINQLLVFTWLFADLCEQHTLPPQWYRALASAVTSHHPEEAERQMRQHVRQGIEIVITALKEKTGQTGGEAVDWQTPIVCVQGGRFRQR